MTTTQADHVCGRCSIPLDPNGLISVRLDEGIVTVCRECFPKLKPDVRSGGFDKGAAYHEATSLKTAWQLGSRVAVADKLAESPRAVGLIFLGLLVEESPGYLYGEDFEELLNQINASELYPPKPEDYPLEDLDEDSPELARFEPVGDPGDPSRDPAD